MTTLTAPRQLDAIRKEMLRHRAEVDAHERHAAGVFDDEHDQLREGSIFVWMAACFTLFALTVGYWLAGLAFLTSLTHAVLIVGVVYGLVAVWRDHRRDCAKWKAIKSYLNRHAG